MSSLQYYVMTGRKTTGRYGADILIKRERTKILALMFREAVFNACGALKRREFFSPLHFLTRYNFADHDEMGKVLCLAAATFVRILS